MTMQNYRYTGPNSAITLVLADNSEHEAIMWTNSVVALPDDHDTVATLLAQGLLTLEPVAAPVKTTPKSTASPAN